MTSLSNGNHCTFMSELFSWAKTSMEKKPFVVYEIARTNLILTELQTKVYAADVKVSQQ